jgi:nitroreductase
VDYAELILKRESCRNYDPARKVEREKIEQCLNAARLAPSACNSQPWHYWVITNGESVKKAAKATQVGLLNGFTKDCPVLVAVTEEEAFLRQGQANQKFAQMDLGLSVSQFCCMATELGLSTCIMGAFDEQAIRKIASIPDTSRLRLVLALGYAKDASVRKKTRKPLGEISTFIE